MGKNHSGIRQTPCDSWRIKKNKFVCIMVFKATCSNNISVISVEETGGSGENHWQTLSHDNVVPTTSVVMGIDCIGSCKSNYQMITTTTTPPKKIRIQHLLRKSCYVIVSKYQIWKCTLKSKKITLIKFHEESDVQFIPKIWRMDQAQYDFYADSDQEYIIYACFHPGAIVYEITMIEIYDIFTCVIYILFYFSSNSYLF